MDAKLLIANLALLALAAVPAVASGDDPPPYVVGDGNRVDARTYEGWRTWRALACERCHGRNQEGLVGPPLVESLKVLTKDQFKTTVLGGRIDKGMPNFGATEMVVQNIDGLYAFLKGRSDGAIAPGHVYRLETAAAPAPEK